MPLTIRRGIPADTTLIADMNARMAHETEDLVLDPGTLRAGVEAVLAGPTRGFYFLAELDGEVVGQSMVTYEWSDWRNGWFWWIQSVYVKEAARRQGVFRALYQHIVEEARTAGDVVGIRLYVEEHNQKAQRTYFSLGMCRTSYNMLQRCPL